MVGAACRECLGCQDLSADLHQVSFAGPVAVAWDDRWAQAPALRATDLGCLPGERIVVRDLFRNPLAESRADEVSVEFAHGPVYVEGSRELAAKAQAERAAELGPREVVLAPGGNSVVALPASHGAAVSVQIQPGLPVTASVGSAAQGSGQTVLLAAPAGLRRASGTVRIRLEFGAGVFGLNPRRWCAP